VVIMVVGAGLVVLAIACFVGGLLQVSTDGEGTRDFRRLAVPGRAEVTVEQTGGYTIYYQSTEFVENGVCQYAGGSGTGQVDVECDAADLIAAGEPTIRLGDGDPLPLEPADGDSIGGVGVGSGLERFVAVWEVQLDEAGTYELALEDAPFDTQDLALGWDGSPTPARAFLLMALGPLLGLAGLVVIIVGFVRLLRG